MSTAQVKITLVRSPISTPKKHRDCVRGLGLRKMHQTVVRENTPEVRGMINKVYYLVKVEEA